MYNSIKEQKLLGVFREKVPAPTRIFVFIILKKIELTTPLNNADQGGTFKPSSRAFSFRAFSMPIFGGERGCQGNQRSHASTQAVQS